MEIQGDTMEIQGDTMEIREPILHRVIHNCFLELSTIFLMRSNYGNFTRSLTINEREGSL